MTGGRLQRWSTWRGRRLWKRALLLAAVTLIVALAALFVSRGSSRKEPAAVRSWVAEEFTESRPDLNASPAGNGYRWEVSGGGFRVLDGAVAATVPASGRGFAAVRFDAPPTIITVLIGTIGPGSGIVFGFVDPANYWSVEAAPAYGTWNIYRTTLGTKEYLANSGNNLVPSGSTIEVRRSGGAIQISINGRPTGASLVDEVPEGSAAGLLAAPAEDGTTSWTRFLVSGP